MRVRTWILAVTAKKIEISANHNNASITLTDEICISLRKKNHKTKQNYNYFFRKKNM